jgi:hypothetical protein
LDGSALHSFIGDLVLGSLLIPVAILQIMCYWNYGISRASHARPANEQVKSADEIATPTEQSQTGISCPPANFLKDIIMNDLAK